MESYCRPGSVTIAIITLLMIIAAGSCEETSSLIDGGNSLEIKTPSPTSEETNTIEDLFSFEVVLEGQCRRLESAELCDVTDPTSLIYCIEFLESYEAELREMAELLESFEELLDVHWSDLDEEEQIILTSFLEDLLRRQAILVYQFQSHLKRLWCLLDSQDKREFLDSYEDLLKRQSSLLLGFEDLLHRQQGIGDLFMVDFLSSFENLIRRQAVLLDSFSDFLSVNCHVIEIRKSAYPSCVRPGQEVAYSFRITNKGMNTLEDIKLVDDHLGVIAEDVTLGPYQSRSFSEIMAIDEPVGATVCNLARVYGIDPKGFTVTDVSNKVCIRVKSAAFDHSSVTSGSQSALALGTDNAAANNFIEIGKNQKGCCRPNEDTIDHDWIKIDNQAATAVNNAKATNNIKILSNSR